MCIGFKNSNYLQTSFKPSELIIFHFTSFPILEVSAYDLHPAEFALITICHASSKCTKLTDRIIYLYTIEIDFQ